MTQNVLFRPELVKTATFTPRRHASRYELRAGESLLPNDYIQSPNGRLAFVLQRDGNLVAYATDTPSPKALWASHTEGRPVAAATLQNDSNLVLTDATGGVVWAAFDHPTNASGGKLVAQDDGNVVLIMPNGSTPWATGSYGFDARNLTDKSFFSATGDWLERVWEDIHSPMPPPHWLNDAANWTQDNEPAIYAAFGGAVGFVVGGPAGAAAGSALLKSAFALGQSVQAGKLDPKVILAFAQAASTASGVELPSYDDIPGIDTVQAALSDGERAIADIDVSKLGVDFPSIQANALPWMNPAVMALQQSVAQGKTKVLDTAGNLVLGLASAPNAVTALTNTDIQSRQIPGHASVYWQPSLVHSTGPIDVSNQVNATLQNMGVLPVSAGAASLLARDAANGKEGAANYANGMSSAQDAATMAAALDLTKRLQVRSAYVRHYLGGDHA